MTTKEKKELFDSRKKLAIEAGITDRKLITQVASGTILLEHILPKKSEVKVEQGNDMAGEKPEETSRKNPTRSVEESKQSVITEAQHTKEDAIVLEKENIEKKIYRLKFNVNHNGVSFNHGDILPIDDRYFEDLKNFLE